jgi:hypothetical protein
MLLTKNNDLKLYNFGLGHMTGYGKVVFQTDSKVFDKKWKNWTRRSQGRFDLIYFWEFNKHLLFSFAFQCVAFPVFGNPRLTSPEVFLSEPFSSESETISGDSDSSPSEPQDSIAHIVTEPRPPPYPSQTSVWRLGMILAWWLSFQYYTYFTFSLWNLYSNNSLNFTFAF